MTHDRKPGYLKQWLDLQAKLIDEIPLEVSITEPSLIGVLPDVLPDQIADGKRTVHKYLVIVMLSDHPDVYCEVFFSVNDLAVQAPAVWEGYNKMKAEEAADELSNRLLRGSK